MSRPHLVGLAIWAGSAATRHRAYLLVPMFWAGAGMAVLCFVPESLRWAMMSNRLAKP